MSSFRRAGAAFKAIGTVPFQLTEWKTNERVELKRGDAGLVQLIPLESLADLQKAPSKNYIVRTVKGGGGFSAIMLNSRKPPFNDERVRRAVALAIDKQEVGLGVWRGFAQPINQMMPPGTPWFFAVPDRKADVEQAKKLLAEVGFARHEADAHGGTGGEPRAGGAGVPGAAHAHRDRHAADWPAYIKRQRAPDFTSTNTNFFPKVDPDDAYYRVFHSKGGANELSGGFANPTADKLLEEGEATIDPAKRAEVYRRFVEIVQDEVPMIITGLGEAAVGWRTQVKGFEPHIIGLLAYPGGGLPNVWLDR